MDGWMDGCTPKTLGKLCSVHIEILDWTWNINPFQDGLVIA